MGHRKDALASRTREQLIKLAEGLAFADNEMRWALIQARRDAGLSQRELAEILGVKQATVSNFESHDNDPRLSTIRRYALAVGAEISHMVRTEDGVFEAGGWTRVPVPAMPTIENIAPGNYVQQVVDVSRVKSRRTDFALSA